MMVLSERKVRALSKYTTEVRFICEHEAGLEDSVGCNDVDRIISLSWNKIFTTNCTFFDNDYRSILCSKILKHYYLREISSETVGIWKLWVNTKLEEIMPYYNKLYESALLEFDPFKDVDYSKNHEGRNDGTKSVDSTTDYNGTKSGESDLTGGDEVVDSGRKTTNGSYTDTGTVGNARDITVDGTASGTGSKGDRYSDTPQGTIQNTDVTGDAYLTNVRLINDSTSGTSHDETYDNNLETRNLAGSNQGTEVVSDTKTTTKNETNEFSETDANSTTVDSDEVVHNTDAYIDRVVGKMNTMPYSDLLMKFRETFLNIDMLVIEEFDELFLQLW